MKKILALLLTVACLASLIAVPASAATLDQETIRKTVIETAFAYYRKGRYIQYESNGITVEHRAKSGVARISTCDSPEQAAYDSTFFTVCSDWCFDVYWEAFNYGITETGRKAMTSNFARFATSDPRVLVKYGTVQEDVTTRDLNEAVAKIQQVWLPGDVLVVTKRSKPEADASGHAMLYIGDTNGDGKVEIMHSSGSKMSTETYVDQVEDTRMDGDFPVGSVRIDTVEAHLLPTDAYHTITGGKYNEIILIRPYLDPNFPKQMTTSAQSRMKFPGLDIDRSTNVHKYNTVRIGDEVTVTVTLKNFSDKALTGIPVSEKLPQGGTVVDGSVSNGGALSASGITWKVDLAPKGEVKLTYKVKVTGARGTLVQMPGGTVDLIPTRDLSYIIGGKALADTAALKAYADGKDNFGLPTTVGAESDAANSFYLAAMGIELNIPAKMQDVMDALLTPVYVPNASSTNAKMLGVKPADQLDETGKYLNSMIVPENLAGRVVWKPSLPNSMKPQDRVYDYNEAAYEPGDIFLCLEGSSTMEASDPAKVVVYVYLGDGRVAILQNKTAKVGGFSDTIATLLRMSVIVLLRPSLAYENVNAGAAPFKFTDVNPKAWYYAHVRALYGKKVINGMTETTFVPNGNLTYGQALKLITLAVGEKEQAAANGHWAGGYLALAKSKGWLSGNVDLNTNINRLQFCQIAAKAAGITAQPEKNPFVDTADTSVLALYNAGVINGMNAVNFAPNGLLTRAQIAKIIWCLQAL